MISGDIVVLRPAAQGIPPGVALPAGPQGLPGKDGAPGPQGIPGTPGVPGVIQSIAGLSKADITQQDMVSILTAIILGLPNTIPSQAGVLWNNGGIIQIS